MGERVLDNDRNGMRIFRKLRKKKKLAWRFFLQDQVFGNSENGVSKNVLYPPMGI